MRAKTMNRTKAAAIAKDLVEGGIEDRQMIGLTAEAHGVTLPQVRKVRAAIMRTAPITKPGPSYNATRFYNADAAKSALNSHLCSMVDAIANGWEDENLGLTAE